MTREDKRAYNYARDRLANDDYPVYSDEYELELAYKAGIEDAKNHPNWISVEDEFPSFDFKNDGTWKYSDNVLIYSPLRGIFVGRYECDDIAGKTYWLFGGAKLPTVEDTGEGYSLVHVTHWLPLPQAPKKGGKK